MSQLINPAGPEANNARAEEFEDQVVRWADALGWGARCRNVDLYAKEGDQSKGVDVLLAFDDPQLGQRQGMIGEAKIRHPLTGKLRDDVASLAKKLAELTNTIPRLDIGNDLVVTRTGLLVYDAKPFRADRVSEALSSLEPAGLTRAEYPREVLVIAPDTLVGLADAFAPANPAQFFWPPFESTAGCWAECAPPHQVTAGLLAWQDATGETTLWVRDPQPNDDDLPALEMIAWEWRIDIDRVVCSSIGRDEWRVAADRWRKAASQSAKRAVGKLPQGIEPRGLSFDSLTAFSDRWGEAA